MPHILVVVGVPEVEPFVAQLRERFDRSAGRGLGAHVTLLHAPLPPNGIDAAMIETVAEAISGVAPFRYAVTGLAHFPSTLYLAVEPAAPFELLNARLGPPQARAFVPHISIVRTAQPGDQAIAEAELAPVMARHAPIECVCRDVVLLEDSTGVWQPVRSFALSGCTDNPSRAPS